MGGEMIDDKTRDWLKEHYPTIKVVSPTQLRGLFRFGASRVGERTVRVHHSISATDNSPLEFISDCYSIFVCLDDPKLPLIWECSGRLQAYARKIGKDFLDLHVYRAGNLCLGLRETVTHDISEHPGVGEFLDRLVVPYFYYYSYCEKYGNEPWPGLPHRRDLALLEQIYHDRKSPRMEKILVPAAINEVGSDVLLTRNELLECLCGSGRNMVECHPRAAEGHKILTSRMGPEHIELRPSLRDVRGRADNEKK